MRQNPLIQTDSYKISHSKMYPKNMNLQYDYIEARSGGEHPYAVFFGLQIFIKDILMNPFTQQDIDEAEEFYNNHFSRNDVFDKEMFQYILTNYDGYFPVIIRAVPEGTIVPENNVLCTFECDDPKCASIVSFLEAMATSYIWYGTTVATNSYAMKQIIKKFGEETCDNLEFLPFALHDFGARGVIPGGQKVGGAAHLVNFMGSDTLEGVWAASYYYGMPKGQVAGYSVPATEHSVMCSEGREGEMVVAQRVFDQYATANGIISMVNDTYDMYAHVKNFSKLFKEKYQKTGVRWVTRPDSGYPPEVVINCLNILWEEFGGTINNKGYKVLDPSVRIIQGDGIDLKMLTKILLQVKNTGYATENVIFGSGGGLLQKVNRDTLRFAMKASYIEVNNKGRDIYKQPVTQTGNYNKKSKKGRVNLYYSPIQGFITSAQKTDKIKCPLYDAMYIVYNKGIINTTYTFSQVRTNVNTYQ